MTRALARSDIVAGDRAGGANTSHTIALELLGRLLATVPGGASAGDYHRAAVDDNVLGRSTLEGRRRAFRYLRELYLLDPSRLLFRALRDLWDEDPAARPLLAGLAALARDSVFRASAAAVVPAPPGTVVSSADLARAVAAAFPGSYSGASVAKIGRNTGSSWTQTGHLRGRTGKTRVRVEARPAAAAFALLLGHVQGARGQGLFTTRWAGFLDRDAHELTALVERAGLDGYLENRSAGGVVEIGFRHLLRPFDREDAEDAEDPKDAESAESAGGAA
ncbi:hypothetical protein [Actinacidiphila sp. ITFR-21]|uniref:hypothetical protein n=1 Tax=Actinacidiphila sp. ITFR-21 TaxID=3075199 RepID=UPI0028894627|nr:hypothetical protein [Streptomyces sp. ITFR-21]WNI14278.1 hypothetical protein RLT57_01180 [Streptomyces sp. ITFR-21]